MSKTSTIFLTFCIMLLLGSCSWVDDDLSKCPKGNWLKISYAYNMLNVDAASTQLGDVSLFIFDQEGTLVHKEEVDSLTIHENNCIMLLPELPEGDYDFVVWGGLDEENYTVVPHSIELKRDADNINDKKLSPLFHGRLDKIHLNDDYSVHDLFLCKLTNVFSCTLQSKSEEFAAVADDYQIEITSYNAEISDRNSLGHTPVTYRPFLEESASIEGIDVIHSGLNTLRLLVNDGTRFRLIYRPTGDKIIDIPLSDYLLMSRHIDYMNMDPQEYLDREDRYNLIFLMSESNDPCKPPYICMQMQINSWIVRIQDGILESTSLF